LVEYPPKLAVWNLVNSLKGVSSRLLRKEGRLPRPEQAVVNFVPRAEPEASPREIKKVIAAANNHFRGQAAAWLGIQKNRVPDDLAKAFPRLLSE
jgi:REP element-mobilizing transposase RayT